MNNEKAIREEVTFQFSGRTRVATSPRQALQSETSHH
jgi:hypothetical protein